MACRWSCTKHKNSCDFLLELRLPAALAPITATGNAGHATAQQTLVSALACVESAFLFPAAARR
jgi:hypothetical protein